MMNHARRYSALEVSRCLGLPLVVYRETLSFRLALEDAGSEPSWGLPRRGDHNHRLRRVACVLRDRPRFLAGNRGRTDGWGAAKCALGRARRAEIGTGFLSDLMFRKPATA